MSTLHFVPWISLKDVVSLPDSLNYSKALFNKTFIRGDELPLDTLRQSRPLRSREKGTWAFTFWPSTQQQTALVIQSISSLAVVVII
jgi:hypothetical protein